MLARAALFFALQDQNPSTASTILQNHRFHGTDAARDVRKSLVLFLVKELDTLSPAQLSRLIDWVWSDSGMERNDWLKIAGRLRKRWDIEKGPDVQHALAGPLVRILSWLGPEESADAGVLDHPRIDGDVPHPRVTGCDRTPPLTFRRPRREKRGS